MSSMSNFLARPEPEGFSASHEEEVDKLLNEILPRRIIPVRLKVAAIFVLILFLFDVQIQSYLVSQKFRDKVRKKAKCD